MNGATIGTLDLTVDFERSTLFNTCEWHLSAFILEPDTMRSEIRYATNRDGQSVAYQICGDGPLDLVFMPDWVGNLEVMWEDPTLAAFLERLARFARVICFDKRGTGLSDPVPLGAIPTWEEWMYDVGTVMDAADSAQAAIFGHGDGGRLALLFAATHPDRSTALILVDAYAKRTQTADYQCGVPEDVAPKLVDAILSSWGTGEAARVGAPSLARDESFIAWRGRYERLAMSPGQFNQLYPLTYSYDLRWVLPSVRLPTLILHRAGNPYVVVGNGRYLAQHINGARYVEIPGADHIFHAGDTEAMLGPVQEFLTGRRVIPELKRVLATVLFTDIVGATATAERLGDGAWRELLERHHALVRRELAHFGGHEIDTSGDGFLASFEGPARGVRCAMSIRDAVRQLGLEIRAGLHTGECEWSGEKLAGIAVHIGARVAGLAEAGEVLVSRTVKDLVAGSGLVFVDRGEHPLKGVSDRWQLFRADGGSA
jgi:class 3 adenylate cyclase